MSGKKTTIMHTQVYNGEKTLRRTIDSVLNQTYRDFIYSIYDNASTDTTADIIEEYMKHDKRIVIMRGDVNDPYWSIKNLITNCDKYAGDVWAILDADDEYEPEFLEKTLAFMEANNLDIVAGGTQFFDANTGERRKERYAVAEDFVFEKKDFKERLPQFIQFAGTMWGSLYSVKMLKKCNFDDVQKVFYGADTIFTMETFSRAERIGVLGGTLHKYYASPGSLSYVWDDVRVESNQTCCDMELEFLRRNDAVSDRNEMIIYEIYSRAVIDTISLSMRSKLDSIMKLNVFRDIFRHHHTQTFFYKYRFKDEYYARLQGSVQEHVASLFVAKKGEGFELATDIFAAMRDILVTPAWSDRELFLFLIAIRAKRDERRDNSDIDKRIEELLSKNALFAGMSADCAIFLRDTVYPVFSQEPQAALDNIIQLMGAEIPDEHVEPVLLLAQNIAAAADDGEGYLYFKKIWIEYLVSVGRGEEAAAEIDEFGQLFPDEETGNN